MKPNYNIYFLEKNELEHSHNFYILTQQESEHYVENVKIT